MEEARFQINKSLEAINKVKGRWEPRDQGITFTAQGASDEEEDKSDFSRWTWHADAAASTQMGNADKAMFD